MLFVLLELARANGVKALTSVPGATSVVCDSPPGIAVSVRAVVGARVVVGNRIGVVTAMVAAAVVGGMKRLLSRQLYLTRF